MIATIISDTHKPGFTNLLVNLPDTDVLIHAGDATFQGTIPEISAFNNELGKIKHKYKHIIFIPGNHDWLFQNNESLARSIMTNATVLIDQMITIDNINIYGSPWQPEFCNWAFNFPRNSMKDKWKNIPDEADIVITHGPVANRLDLCPDKSRVGCKALFDRLLQIQTSYHICGHIHDAYGIMKDKHGITYINASMCDEQYEHMNNPIIMEIK